MAKSTFTRKTWTIIAGAGVLAVGAIAVGATAMTGNAAESGTDFKTTSASEGSSSHSDDGSHRDAAQVSPGEAASTALDDIGEAVVTSVELEEAGAYWDVDLTTPKQEHEVRIDASNGKIVDKESDDEDSDDWKEDSAVANAADIDIDDAVAAATAEVSSANVTSVELEGNSNAPQWEVELRSDDGKTTVVVDAKNGSIVKQFKGDDDDDDDNDDNDDNDD